MKYSAKGRKRHVSRGNTSPLFGRDSELYQLSICLRMARRQFVNVVSVWGHSGVGKSALVEKLYSRIIDEGHMFVKYGWVDVSYPFNMREFSQSLRQELNKSDSIQANIDPIEECCQLLKAHRCLLVIDGLQSTQEWHVIQAVLISQQSKSVIIVISNEAIITSNRAQQRI